MSKKALILEDEDNIRSFVVINLKRAGFETAEFALGEEAVAYVRNHNDIDVAILDVMLPDIDGFEVCRRIRGSGSRMGIIMLTAMSQETDKINGFMTGADDYVVKPFSVVELVARTEALYRRLNAGAFSADSITSGPFSLNTRSRELKKNGERVDLTQVEYLIVKNFLENRGRALSRDDIMNAVWGSDYHGDLKVVDVNIRRLRLKIENDPATPKFISTIWGFGYKWEA
ncbi:response regulator transcription factor [Acidaminobacterium chupaoyuni]